MNEKQPETRTRVNFTNTAKGGWKVSEITVECLNHPNPIRATRELFLDLQTEQDEACAYVNRQNPPTLKP